MKKFFALSAVWVFAAAIAIAIVCILTGASNVIPPLLALTFKNRAFVGTSSYTSLFAAKQAAREGDTIYVSAGFYSGSGVTNLLKHNVHWKGFPGVVISNNSTTCGIFDNTPRGNGGAVTCIVDLAGAVLIDTGNRDNAGCLAVSNSASVISFTAKKAHYIPSGGNLSAGITILNCSQVTLDVDVASCQGAATGGFWWVDGYVTGRIGEIYSENQAALYCTGSNAANCDLTVNRIVCTNGAAIFMHPTHANNKLWLQGLNEAIGEGIDSGGSIDQSGGKLYIPAYGKLSQVTATTDNLSRVINVTGGTLWIRGNKITTTNDAAWFTQSGGSTWIDNQEWEDAGSVNPRPYNFLLSGGTNVMSNGRAKSFWGPAYKLSGGEVYLNNMTINTFGTLQGSNVCLWITGGTPVIRDAVFIPGSLFSASNASAGDLRIYGYLRAKSNITATLTPRVGAVIVDGTYVDR